MEKENTSTCPECKSTDIKSLGYNYDLARVFYECADCDHTGDSSEFEQDDEEFEVVTISSFDDSATETVAAGLSWDEAFDLANLTFDKGQVYGVEIISMDPNNMEPIVWIRTQK